MQRTRKPSLTTALKRATAGNVGTEEGAVAAAEPSPLARKPTATAPSREGKQAISAFFDPGVRKSLKEIALQQDRTLQSVMAEAVNDLFAKYGRARIAS